MRPLDAPSPRPSGAALRRRWLPWAGAGAIALLLSIGAGYGWMAADPGHAMRTLQAMSIDGPLGPPNAIKTDVGPVMTWTVGEGAGPATILIHGFGDAGAGWVQVAQALSSEGEVHILDLPGHGRSAHPTTPLRLADLVAGVDAVARTVEGPVIVVGNSLGGWVAAEWALSHPERVERLVLVNTAGFEQPLDPEVLLPSTREGVLRKNRIVMGAHAPALPGVMLDGLVAMHQESWLRPLFDHLTAEAPKLDERLGAFPGRVELVWGTPDAFFPEDGYLSRIQRVRPEAPTTMLRGCGHAPQYGCAEALARAIQSLE